MLKAMVSTAVDIDKNGEQHLAGLSQRDAERLLDKYGPNSLPDTQGEAFWQRFLRQFKNPLIYILLFALSLDLIIWLYKGHQGFPVESLTIGLILMANAFLSLWQEAKSEKALKKLKQLSAPQSHVFRDGQFQTIASHLLVPGDVIRLEAGDRIPADAVVISTDNFSVDESLLTGESLPITKSADDELKAGTLALRGISMARIVATGVDSTMGHLAGLLENIEDEPSPLERRLTRFGHRVAFLVIGIAVVLCVLGLLITGLGQFSHIFLFAVALAVAAVPESLPAVMTLALSLGVERMARRKAVVRHLSAVETLGSVTVIATDKTGTLTENKMLVKDIDVNDTYLAHLAMALVNDADTKANVGDPLELGLLHFLEDKGVDPYGLRASHPRQSVKPFDSSWKYMRVTTSIDGRAVSLVKGAPEVLLERCSLSVDEKSYWQEKLMAYLQKGYRVLALAQGEGEQENRLKWIGLVLFWDPPREEIADAIAAAHTAGIRVLMITGDHPSTAQTIANKIGIDKTEHVIAGHQLEAATDTEFSEWVNQCNVFARVTPEHKLRIVKELQSQNHTVAVTGDGVNDAPALKAADIGVTMGLRGSDVSREVADLVLLDDNFSTIVAAIEEGRSIYENIQKFIRTLFSTNLTEVLLISLGALISFALYRSADTASAVLWMPLTAAQILWINLLTDSLPALALSVDKNPATLEQSPRPADSPLLDKGSTQFILWAGVLGGAIALALLVILPVLGFAADVVQTAIFHFLVLVQLSFVFPARKVSMLPRYNAILIAAISIVVVLQLATVLFPPLALMLSLGVVPLTLWLVLLVCIGGSWCLANLLSRYLRLRA